jgi:hypothetical protein
MIPSLTAQATVNAIPGSSSWGVEDHNPTVIFSTGSFA